MSRRLTKLPPNWPTLRLKQLAADNWTCQQCGHYSPTGNGLEADHYGHRDDHTHLRTLCTPCHATRTGKQAAAARANKHNRTRPQENHPGIIT